MCLLSTTKVPYGLTVVLYSTSMYQYHTSTICWGNSIVALGSPFFSRIFRNVDARSFSASPLDGPLEQTQGTTVSVTCEPGKHICDIRLMLLGQGIASIAGEFRVQLEAPMGFTLAHAWLIFSRRVLFAMVDGASVEFGLPLPTDRSYPNGISWYFDAFCLQKFFCRKISHEIAT